MLPLRFIRRDGPRIFLDTRDLIGVLEKGTPLSVSDLVARLSKVNGRVVLVYTNVAELVPQTDSKRPHRSHVRSLMRELERLPLSYMRSQEIARHEFRAAIDAFESGSATREVNPYVNQWWQVVWRIPAEYMAIISPEKNAALRQMPLWQAIDILVENDPESLRFGEQDRQELADAVEDDRRRLKTSRGTAESFMAAVKEIFRRYGWPEPKRGFDTFSDFVRADARVCPGWRISHDVYEEYRCNLTAPVAKGDIPDFSHVSILPYVTHATLDRAWRGRCAQTRDRIRKSGLWTDPYDRVFPDLSAVLSALGLAA